MQTGNTHDWYTARSVDEAYYGFKVLIESGPDRMLGAHLIGPHADEAVNIFCNSDSQWPDDTPAGRHRFSHPTALSMHYVI
jgi:glutathione reductase (NADPH)